MGRTSDARERLIQTVAELVYARGYNAVGVKEVCERAGVHKGSFYHFFPSKRDLVLAALDIQWETYSHTFLEPTFDEDLPPLEKVQKLLQRGSGDSISHGEQMRGCPFGNLAVELSTQDEVIREKLQAIFDDWIDHFEQLLREAVEAGELPDLDPRTTAESIIAYLQGIFVMAKTYNDPHLVERLAPGIAHLVASRAEASSAEVKPA